MLLVIAIAAELIVLTPVVGTGARGSSFCLSTGTISAECVGVHPMATNIIIMIMGRWLVAD
ncbi:MAG TPA: hypothetical protein VFC51_12205 [Chloroflexota bacterium]|nr:hypothetical protein [Chloroflexota bacterium]